MLLHNTILFIKTFKLLMKYLDNFFFVKYVLKSDNHELWWITMQYFAVLLYPEGWKGKWVPNWHIEAKTKWLPIS